MKVKRLSDNAILNVSNKAYALVYSKCSDFEVYNGVSDEEQPPEEQQLSVENPSEDKPQTRKKKATPKPKDIAPEDNIQKSEGDANGDTAKSEDTL